jgi:hypothetical protein
MSSQNTSINNGDFYDEENDLLSEVNQPLINSDGEEVELEDANFPKARHVFALVGFCGFAIVYAMRVNLSISIVSMVNQSAINNNQTFTDVCPLPTPTSNSSVPAVSVTT